MNENNNPIQPQNPVKASTGEVKIESVESTVIQPSVPSNNVKVNEAQKAIMDNPKKINRFSKEYFLYPDIMKEKENRY